MNEMQNHPISCPYCGEWIDIDIDCSEENHRYIEDCSVCCQPINVQVTIDFEHHVQIVATHDNE